MKERNDDIALLKERVRSKLVRLTGHPALPEEARKALCSNPLLSSAESCPLSNLFVSKVNANGR